MMVGGTRRVVASLALAGCLMVIPLSGCQDAPSTAQSNVDAAAVSVPASDNDDVAQESAPTLQATTSAVTIPVDFFDILGISQDRRAWLLESFGATDIDAQEDGSYVVSLSSNDFAVFASRAYQAIQDKIKSSTTDGTYTDVVSVDYDETFATVVVVLDSDTIPDSDIVLATNLGRAANLYQQIAGLPVDCDVIVMSSAGETLSESVFPEPAKA